MKNLFLLLFLFTITSSIHAQFTVKKIIKPSEASSCDGKIILEFEESELPAELLVVSQSNGGSLVVESKVYTINDLCADTYTITMTDNHQCVTEEVIELETCAFDIDYTISRGNCEDKNGFSIELENLPEHTLQFKWSHEGQVYTDHNESNLSNIGHGLYFVTISDEYKCSQILEAEIQNTDISIANITHPSFGGGGCDGRVSLKADDANTEFTIRLKVNFQTVYTITTALNGEEFAIPVDLCHDDEISVEIIDTYFCFTSIPINLKYSNCESLFLSVNELWHASNWGDWNNGKVKVVLSDPNLNPNDFMFKLYRFVGNSEVLIDSGIGKTEFTNLDANCQKYDWEDCDFIGQGEDDHWEDNLSYWYCDYKVSVEQISSPNCKKSVYAKVRQCSNNLAPTNGFNLKDRILDENGAAKITWYVRASVLDYRYDNNTYIITGPSGQIFDHLTYPAPVSYGHSQYTWYKGKHYRKVVQREHQDADDYCIYASNSVSFGFYVFEPGEYCITVDDGCGNIVQQCLTVHICAETLNLKSNGYLVYPSDRDHANLGEGYENIEHAFVSSNSNACILDPENCSDSAAKYSDNNWQCNDDKKYFTFTPHDENNPCDGGVVTMYDTQELFGKNKVFYNASFEVNEPADYSFEWFNH